MLLLCCSPASSVSPLVFPGRSQTSCSPLRSPGSGSFAARLLLRLRGAPSRQRVLRALQGHLMKTNSVLQHRGVSQPSCSPSTPAARGGRRPASPGGLTDPRDGFTATARPGGASGTSCPHPPQYLHCNRCRFMRFLSLKRVVVTSGRGARWDSNYQNQGSFSALMASISSRVQVPRFLQLQQVNLSVYNNLI